MASIVLLLSELLGGGESGSVLAADRYIKGCYQSLGQFRPAVTVTEAAAAAQQDGRTPGGHLQVQHHAAAATACGCQEERMGESFEDLAATRIQVDVMWP